VFDVGLPEFFVLGLVALLVFGPDRLPEVALQAARLIRRLRGMAESARTELTADLEPHMRELKELRDLDPRKMAKRYILDPVDEDGTFKSLRGKNLLSGDAPKQAKGTAAAAAATARAASAAAVAADGAAETAAAMQSNGSSAATSPGALPSAMAPSVTPAGERPPYDLDAT
jgi:sec-independent protein translocase protein TatB